MTNSATPITLPVSVAKSFSKLKLIKTYLRPTIAGDRILSVAISSIKRAAQEFAGFKDCKVAFYDLECTSITPLLHQCWRYLWDCSNRAVCTLDFFKNKLMLVRSNGSCVITATLLLFPCTIYVNVSSVSVLWLIQRDARKQLVFGMRSWMVRGK